MRLRGGVVPIITPVDVHKKRDVAAFEGLIEHLLQNTRAGIFEGGSAGMGLLLTDSQRQLMAETAAEYVADRCALLGGVICTSTARVIAKIKFLERSNYQYMAATPTCYNTLNRDEPFLSHFQKCYDSTDMKMVVYNIPSCTYSGIPPTVLETMAV